MNNHVLGIGAFARQGPLLLFLFFSLGQLIFGLPELLMVLMCVSGVWCGRRLMRQPNTFPNERLHLFLLPAAFASVFFLKLISASWALSPSSAVDNAFNHVHFLLWPFIFYYFVENRRSTSDCLHCLSACLVLMLIWALAAQWFFPDSEQAACFYAGVHNCGLLGQTAGISIILMTWGLLFLEERRFVKLLWAISTVAALFVIWIAERRTEWIAMLLCLPLIVLFSSQKALRLRYLVLPTLGVIAILVGMALQSSRFHLAYTEAQAYLTKPQLAESTESSVGSRLEMYRIAKEAIALRPIFGWGAGIKPKHLDKVSNELRNNYPYSHFHNQYLQVLLEVGFFGAFICICIIAYALKVAVFDQWHSAGGAYAVCLLVLFIYHAIRGLANHSIGYSAPNSFIVVVTAWLCAEMFRQKHKAQTQTDIHG